MKRWLLFLVLISCSDKKTTESVLTPKEFEARYKATENAILLDVRRPEEIAGGKIANSQNIVWDDTFADNIGGLEHKPIFIYCASGIRSAKAAAVLRDKGYTEVYELYGGMAAWKAADMPVE